MSQAAASSRRLSGEAASPGLLAGRIVVERAIGSASRNAGTAAEEADALCAAIDSAIEALSELMAEAGGEAAEVLAFQVAMLEDESLSEDAFQAIGDGKPADQAWREALDPQVADYANADDSYFRARSADLRDLRDRVLGALSGSAKAEIELPPGAILLAEDITPSRFLAQDWSGRGIALEAGSASSHVAMLARARGVPMVLGLGPVPAEKSGAALLDGEAGVLILQPDETERSAFEQRLSRQAKQTARFDALAKQPAVTAEGEPVAVMLNVATPNELDHLDPAICDGVGLVRSEFLFYGRDELPDEAEQLAAYSKILRWAGKRPVIIRTLDAGGDKPIEGLTEAGESNPFLGRRGIRLSLARPEVFCVQLRALLRASLHGQLKVMLPMVAKPEEVAECRRLLDEARKALSDAGVPFGRPQLGIMVEVPAAALTLDRFEIDFASIGSNDLIQYTMAAARDSSGLGALQRADEPAVLRLITEVVDAAGRKGIDVSLCGDAGGDPQAIPHLLGAGLRALSMAPPAVGRAKAVIAEWRRGEHG